MTIIKWFKQNILYNHKLFGGMSDADFLNFRKDMKYLLDSNGLEKTAKKEIEDLKKASNLLTYDNEKYAKAKKAFERKAWSSFFKISIEALENHRIRVIDRRWSFCLGLIGRYIFVLIIGVILGLLF